MILSVASFASSVMTKGAELGKWTQDIEAAKKLAAKEKKLILLNFTGSDWCGWCKLMDKKVFATDEWQRFAKESLVMVYIDFPQNKSLVPEEYVARNQQLYDQFGVEGYPSYRIVDETAQNVLGTLGAAQDITPAAFIASVNEFLTFTPAVVEKTAEKMPAELKKKYLAAFAKLNANTEEINQWKAQEPKDETKAYMAEMREIKLEALRALLNDDDKEKLAKAQADLAKATAEFKNWIATSPEQNEANMAIYQKMRAEIKAQEAVISSFTASVF